GHERVEYRRLPDARLTGEEDELARARTRARETRLERGDHAVASNERAVGLRDARPRRGARPPRDESIAAARDRLDEARLIGFVPEGAGDPQNDRPQAAVGPVRAPPHGAQQVVLPDELAGILDQATEHRERLRRERDRLALVQEPLVGEVERIAVERLE